MGDVIDLFTGAPIAEIEDTRIQEFVSEHLNEFLFAVQGLAEADNESDARGFMDEIRELVASWPP